MKSYFGCRLGLVLLVVLLLLATFPLTGFAQSPHLVVNTHRLNIRSGPGVGHHVITSVPGGTELPVTGIDIGRLWFQISGPTGPGWVNSHYAIDRGSFSGVPIIDSRPANVPVIAPGQAHLVVNTGYLNVRTGPGVGHNAIGNVPGGTELPVTAIDSGGLWYQVDSPMGSGWVNSHYTIPRGVFSGIPRIGRQEAADPIAPGTPHLVVNTGYLNVRSGPGASHGIITTVAGGAKLPVISIGSDNLWYEVNSPAGPGWVNSHYTVTRGNFASLRRPRVLNDPPTPALSGPTPRCVVNTHRLNIRTGPGANNDIITSVPGGSHLAVLGLSRGRGWYLVEGSFGQGWLNNDFVVFRGDFSRVPIVQ
ncbi:MAG: SH3 domain-containing protein [Chloroflexi bacterium]|nr:SH3 domain-containing protein [Chloroflexota bacterium]